MPQVHVVSSAGQLKAWFAGVITSFFPKVNVNAAGALDGDGNTALGVRVDGVTIVITGNQLVGATPLSIPIKTTQGGTGTATSFTNGSVVFATTGGVYSQNNTKFFWSTTLEALGIGDVPAAGDRLLVNGNIRISGATSQIGFPNSNGTKLDLTNGGSSIIVQEGGWGIQIGAGVGQGTGQGFLRIVTGDGELIRIGGGPHILLGTLNQPGVGTKGLIFGDGTAPGTMNSTTAGIYADTTGGVTRMFAICGNNTTGQIVMASTTLTSGKIPIATAGGLITDGQTPLGGTKVYYVADTTGGAVTRKLTFTDGILTAET